MANIWIRVELCYIATLWLVTRGYSSNIHTNTVHHHLSPSSLTAYYHTHTYHFITILSTASWYVTENLFQPVSLLPTTLQEYEEALPDLPREKVRLSAVCGWVTMTLVFRCCRYSARWRQPRRWSSACVGSTGPSSSGRRRAGQGGQHRDGDSGGSWAVCLRLWRASRMSEAGAEIAR